MKKLDEIIQKIIIEKLQSDDELSEEDFFDLIPKRKPGKIKFKDNMIAKGLIIKSGKSFILKPGSEAWWEVRYIY